MCSLNEMEKLIKHEQTPTYLKYLLKRDDQIVLVCAPKPKSVNLNESENDETIVNNELELTGNPLTLDLSCNDSISSDIEIPPTYCTPDELKHYPTTLQIARKCLNELNKNVVEDDDKIYFFLCDGKDFKKIVLISSHQKNRFLTTTIVSDFGYVLQNDDCIKIDSMIAEHKSNIRDSSVEIESSVSAIYSLFGHDLRISYNSKAIGSILIDAQWKGCEFNIPRFKSELNLRLQQVTGNSQPHLKYFWTELLILHHLIDNRLKNNLNNKSPLIKYKSFSEISSHIGSILSDTYFKKEALCNTNKIMTLESFMSNLNVIKGETILDNLWKLFICCDNVKDLKDCFVIVFEGIARKHVTHLYIPDDNDTIVANIMRDIYNRKTTIIPYISDIQALELLIEVGIEKIKSDYTFIINFFAFIPGDTFATKWNEGFNNLVNISERSSSINKLSLAPETSMVLQEFAIKLNKLVQLYVSLQFLAMMEQYYSVNKPDSYYTLCSSVFDKCFATISPVNSIEFLKKNNLYEISIPVSYEQLKINDIKTLMWRLEMKSKCRNCQVKTVFLLSDRQILPPTVSVINGITETETDCCQFSVLKMITNDYYL